MPLLTTWNGSPRATSALYEVQRRQKVANKIAELRKERIEKPRLLVEAPTAVINQHVENLPDGVRLERGRITVEFKSAQDGLEKLLALALGISNDSTHLNELSAAKSHMPAMNQLYSCKCTYGS